MTEFRYRSTGATCAIALLTAVLAAPTAQAGSLENLERERALLVEAFIEPDPGPAERQARIALSSRRLVDLERMVLRDDSLTGRNTPTVRRAFANYDLTFLVHAATEQDMAVVDIWLEQIGITSQSILSARRGRR